MRRRLEVGGPDRDRTGDLMNAIHARSQLRYWPTCRTRETSIIWERASPRRAWRRWRTCPPDLSPHSLDLPEPPCLDWPRFLPYTHEGFCPSGRGTIMPHGTI